MHGLLLKTQDVDLTCTVRIFRFRIAQVHYAYILLQFALANPVSDPNR